jgi:hypothetical protein
VEREQRAAVQAVATYSPEVIGHIGDLAAHITDKLRQLPDICPRRARGCGTSQKTRPTILQLI